ncbi:MAG: preprotein translocase subunit YajC [Pelotomaculum sp.]|jgi:preprotein translocase subunit YajC
MLGNNSTMVSLLYIIGLFVILYFLMIRPQQQRQKKHQQMIKNLKANDRIVTIGGIYGTIVKIKEDSLILKIADNTEIEILQTAVSRIDS